MQRCILATQCQCLPFAQVHHSPAILEITPTLSVTVWAALCCWLQESVTTTVLVFVMFQCPMLVWMIRRRQLTYHKAVL